MNKSGAMVKQLTEGNLIRRKQGSPSAIFSTIKFHILCHGNGPRSPAAQTRRLTTRMRGGHRALLRYYVVF